MKIEKRMVAQYGVTIDGVWLPWEILEELSEQGVWDSQWGDAYIRPDPDQERVLVARGLAVKETRGGLHRGSQLDAFMEAVEFPRQATVYAAGQHQARSHAGSAGPRKSRRQMRQTLTPEQRTLRARKAALSRWAREDPGVNAARGQAGLMARFEREVDPDGQLDPAERARRAECARRAWMTGLALASSRAREQRSQGAAAPRGAESPGRKQEGTRS